MNDNLAPNPLLVMPLSSSAQASPILRVPPSKPTRIINKPVHGAFNLARIIVGDVGTDGGAADWIVNYIEIDGRSQLKQKNLPGALFSSCGVGTAKRSWTELRLSGFDTVERGCELALVVTYIGSHPEGVPFLGAALGSRPLQRPTMVLFSTGVELLPTIATTINLCVENAPVQIHRLVIDDAGTAGGPADWIVNDMRVNGKSQFSQSGDMPGDIFRMDVIDNFVSIDRCPAGGLFEIVVTYIGDALGAAFAGRLEGTVVHDDPSRPPPDLRVRVEVDGKSSGVVVGTCDWRPPSTSNSVP